MFGVSFFELVIAYSIGLLLLLYVISFFLKVKEKTLLYLTVNSIAGAVLFFILTLFTPLQPASANLFLCGLLGIIACVLIIIISI